MPKIAAIAKVTAVEGQRDAVVKVLDQLVDAAEAEPGTEIYAMNLDVSDPNVIWFYELYTDDAAFAAHGQSETMKAVGGELRGLTAGRAEVHLLTPHRGVGVDL
jgi:quinol monooxygenase YgiN